MIIGITGTNAAGKDTAAGFFKDRGFFHCSLSDIVRRECDDRKMPKDRDTLRNVANEMRKTGGPAVLAERALKIISKYAGQSIVITSIRGRSEAETLKKELQHFILLAIDAPIELRFKRTKERGRDSDFIDFENFKRQEELEMTGGEGKQNIDALLKMADHTIINDGTVDELYEKIKKTLRI
jgi:dephospho-CoA kinase